MIALGPEDTLQINTDVANVIDYSVHGYIDAIPTILAHGQSGAVIDTTIFTAVTHTRIESIVLVNNHTSAVKVALFIGKHSSGVTRYILHKEFTMPANNTVIFDGHSVYMSGVDTEVIATLASIDEDRIAGRISGGVLTGLTGAQVRTILGTAPFVLGSDANGDMWYRASGLLARLAIGSADRKLFVNAGGTAPEWAAGVYCITTTRYADASTGNIAVTGVGFKPSVAIAFVQISNTESISLGMYFGGNGAAFGYLAGAGWQNGSGALILMYPSGGGYTYASVNSWDSDGMTLTWVNSTSPAPGHEEMKIVYGFFR